jgi:hypothetical protein
MSQVHDSLAGKEQLLRRNYFDTVSHESVESLCSPATLIIGSWAELDDEFDGKWKGRVVLGIFVSVLEILQSDQG